MSILNEDFPCSDGKYHEMWRKCPAVQFAKNAMEGQKPTTNTLQDAMFCHACKGRIPKEYEQWCFERVLVPVCEKCKKQQSVWPDVVGN